MASLYRLRDRVFHRTAGGRRITALYYAHGAAMAAAGAADPVVITRAGDALAAWMPVVQALVDGRGSTVTVGQAQVDAFLAFLDALAAAADDGLREAILRERALVGPEAFAGLTADAVLARVVENASCAPEPTIASVRCRLAQLRRLVQGAGVPARLGKKLARTLGKAEKPAQTAEALAGSGAARKRRRAALGKVLRRVTQVERRLRGRAGRALDAALRALLAGDASALRADVRALRKGSRRRPPNVA